MDKLSNTFFNSECIYVPTATQVSSTTTGGGSLNLGGVANALGVGGAVGAIAGGVNVGGSKGNTVSEIQYSQRVIAIPPHGWKEIFSRQNYSRDVVSAPGNWKIYMYAIKFDVTKNNQGESKDYNFEGQAKDKIFVSYSKSEVLSGQVGKMSAEIYPMRLVYIPIKRFSDVLNNNTGNNLWQYIEAVGK